MTVTEFSTREHTGLRQSCRRCFHLSAVHAPAPAGGCRTSDCDCSAVRSSTPAAPVARHVFPRKDGAAFRGALLELRVEVRYNSRAAAVELSEETADENGTATGLLTAWQPLTDRVEAELRERVGSEFSYLTTRGPSPLAFGTEAWRDALLATIRFAEEDPFEIWIEQLPEWDRRPRIDELLIRHFDAADTLLTRWASGFLFMGPLARTFEPGLKLDQMPVLVGEQGLGKSALLRALFPREHPEWFSDGLNLADRTRERAEALLGRVIVEASEMTGANRAEIESLKAFITRQDDGNVRLAYARRPETMLRRCIIVGTTNSRESLPNDVTGLRRFVPVELWAADEAIEELADADREQWWAEARARLAAGERASMPRELIPEQTELAVLPRKVIHRREAGTAPPTPPCGRR